MIDYIKKIEATRSYLPFFVLQKDVIDSISLLYISEVWTTSLVFFSTQKLLMNSTISSDAALNDRHNLRPDERRWKFLWQRLWHKTMHSRHKLLFKYFICHLLTKRKILNFNLLLLFLTFLSSFLFILLFYLQSFAILSLLKGCVQHTFTMIINIASINTIIRKINTACANVS